MCIALLHIAISAPLFYILFSGALLGRVTVIVPDSDDFCEDWRQRLGVFCPTSKQACYAWEADKLGHRIFQFKALFLCQKVQTWRLKSTLLYRP